MMAAETLKLLTWKGYAPKQLVDKFEQETFFIADPNSNVLEIKSMKNPDVLFDTE